MKIKMEMKKKKKMKKVKKAKKKIPSRCEPIRAKIEDFFVIVINSTV